jgi:hypothetical protein
MPEVRMDVKQESDTAALAAELQRRVDEVVAATCEAIADSARNRAPVRTGYLRSSIGHDDHEVWAEAPYASYVNYGTRWMHFNPFFSDAVAHEGMATLTAGLAAIFGHMPTPPLTEDEAVFLTGPLKGVPHTFPYTAQGRRDVANYLSRQRNRARLGYGDSKWRPRRHR